MSGSKAAAAGLAAAIALGLARIASAQDASAPLSPPSMDALEHCAGLAADDARLACYDAAMRAAGYAPKPAEVAEEHRKHFGLPLPKLNALKHQEKQEGQAAAGQGAPAPPEENPDRSTVQIAQVATLQPTGKLLIVTDDGQVWEQIDTTQVNDFPKPGDSMEIHKGTLGSYLCEANKYQEVRCKRDR